jgi:hypothetical protein
VGGGVGVEVFRGWVKEKEDFLDFVRLVHLRHCFDMHQAEAFLFLVEERDGGDGWWRRRWICPRSDPGEEGVYLLLLFSVFTDEVLIIVYVTLFLIFLYLSFLSLCVYMSTCSVGIFYTLFFRGVFCQ